MRRVWARLADLMVDPASRPGGGALRGAAPQRPRVARPHQHLLLPEVRRSGRSRAPHLLSSTPVFTPRPGPPGCPGG